MIAVRSTEEEVERRRDRYVEAAVQGALSELAACGAGTRGNTTHGCAKSLGTLVGAGVIGSEDVTGWLLDAAPVGPGFTERDARSHIRNGLRHGIASPRELPDFGGECTTRARVAVQPPESVKAEPLRLPPPAEEVQRLWDACIPVTEDAEAIHWLEGRSIDPEAVALWDLARVIAPATHLPEWAALGPHSWRETGNRLLVPLWSPSGEMASFKARFIGAEESKRKSLSPRGCSATQMAMACPLGRQVLQRGAFPAWVDRRLVLIREGDPDFLESASTQSECDEQGGVVFGMFSGGWSVELADRIPDGTLVCIHTDDDDAGQNYSRHICATIGTRCEVYIRRAHQ